MRALPSVMIHAIVLCEVKRFSKKKLSLLEGSMTLYFILPKLKAEWISYQIRELVEMIEKESENSTEGDESQSTFWDNLLLV